MLCFFSTASTASAGHMGAGTALLPCCFSPSARATAPGFLVFAGLMNYLPSWASSISSDPSCIHGTHLFLPSLLYVAVF